MGGEHGRSGLRGIWNRMVTAERFLLHLGKDFRKNPVNDLGGMWVGAGRMSERREKGKGEGVRWGRGRRTDRQTEKR